MAPSFSILLSLALLGAAADAGAETLDERVPVRPGGHLEVVLDLGEGLRPDPGSLEVVSHDVDEVRVLAETSGWGAASVRTRVEQTGERVRVVSTVTGTFAWMFGGPRVEVRIWVPRHFSLDLRASAGPIRVEDVSGGVRVRARGAAIEVVGVEGSVRLRTEDADLRVREVVGDVELKTTEGDLEASWVTGDLDARTGGGAIEARHVAGRAVLRSDDGPVELRDVSGPVEVKTERGSVFASFVDAPAGLVETRNGSVDVVVPARAGAELDARASGGGVELAGLTLDGEQGETRALGLLNGGGARLQLYTPRGRIRVRAR
ncbi:MAG: DUF4097 family beta strand repeat-containing protein [Myxococcota bacterium]|nr:DUF4097 family beta strand repeat-containing protein [Myxococcota bacterium]